jgi:hypothetical protein
MSRGVADEADVNYGVLYQQQKQIHELEKANHQLRQQIVEDRQAFEAEKEALLARQDELASAVDQSDIFHAQLFELLNARSASDFAGMLESARILVRQKAPDEFTHGQQVSDVIALKDHQLAELEVKLREVKRLYRAAESEGTVTGAELTRLRKKYTKQNVQCEAMRAALDAHLALTNCETAEASISALQVMKTKLYKYRTMVHEGLRPHPELGEIRDLIADQSETINAVVQSIRDFREEFDDVASPENPFRKIPVESKPRVAPNGFLSLPYDDRRASLWMNKTKELLAMERQLVHAQQRLASANPAPDFAMTYI